MTVCKILKEEKRGQYTITAWEMTDKYSCVPRYEIEIVRDSDDGHSLWDTIKCAKTTWRKRFKETVDYYTK